AIPTFTMGPKGMGPLVPEGAMPNLSEADLAELEQFEQSLAQASQEIDQYIATLSPEEQTQFYQSVQEMESMLENMSEDEFQQLMGEMFPGMIPEEMMGQPIPEATIPVEEEKI